MTKPHPDLALPDIKTAAFRDHNTTRRAERKILAAAHACQQATGGHLDRPPLQVTRRPDGPSEQLEYGALA